MYTYKVSDEKIVEVFVEGKKEPMLRQPNYPNQDAFETKSEAEEWAQLFIASVEDENAPFAPMGKGIAGKPKPTKEQILEYLKADVEKHGGNVPQDLADQIAALEAELA